MAQILSPSYLESFTQYYTHNSDMQPDKAPLNSEILKMQPVRLFGGARNSRARIITKFWGTEP